MACMRHNPSPATFVAVALVILYMILSSSDSSWFWMMVLLDMVFRVLVNVNPSKYDDWSVMLVDGCEDGAVVGGAVALVADCALLMNRSLAYSVSWIFFCRFWSLRSRSVFTRCCVFSACWRLLAMVRDCCLRYSVNCLIASGSVYGSGAWGLLGLAC